MHIERAMGEGHNMIYSDVINPQNHAAILEVAICNLNKK